MTEITETLTVERLDELEEIARKATSGPWEAQRADADEYGTVFIVAADLGGLVGAALPQPTEVDSIGSERVTANGAHIAATNPATALSLIALAREGLAGRAEIEALRQMNLNQREMIAMAYEWEIRARDAESELAAVQRTSTLLRAAYEGAASLLLEVQQSCIAEHKRADAAEARERGLHEFCSQKLSPAGPHGHGFMHCMRVVLDYLDSRESTPAQLCEDCPPVGYPTDETRCLPCPRRPLTTPTEPGAPDDEHGND